MLEVAVADTGSGLSNEQVAAINDMAGASTPPRDELSQTGLGLALVRALAQARGGILLAEHTADGGATLVIRFPVEPPPISPPSELPSTLEDEAPLDMSAISALDQRLDVAPFRRRNRRTPITDLVSTRFRDRPDLG